MAVTEPLESTTVQAFSEQVHGEVLEPDDEARTVWNAMIDKRPAVIARCTGAADVIAAVNFARERDLLLSVKGGGHDVAGTAVCDNGLMIDCSPMDSVRVDPRAGTARAGPGATGGTSITKLGRSASPRRAASRRPESPGSRSGAVTAS
jgi:FAD/FMN-containing dehydrogenase